MVLSGPPSAVEKDNHGIVFVRGFFTRTTLASIVLMTVSLAFMAFPKASHLSQATIGVLFDCLYAGALGFFLSSVTRCSLDIMYGILGLLQVKAARIFAWFALSALSLLPLAAIFAFQRLASGFYA